MFTSGTGCHHPSVTIKHWSVKDGVEGSKPLWVKLRQLGPCFTQAAAQASALGTVPRKTLWCAVLLPFQVARAYTLSDPLAHTIGGVFA